MLLGFTDGILLGCNIGFIIQYTTGEMLCSTVGVPVGFIGDIDEGSGICSFFVLYDGSNNINTESSLLGESIRLYDGSALCYFCGFFDVTKDGMFGG